MRTRRNQYPENDVYQPRTTRQNQAAKEVNSTPQAIPNQEAQTSVNPNTIDENLQKLYEDIRAVPSFSAKINDFLRKHELHSKFRRIVKKNFPRRRIIARYPNEIYMADLIEYPKFKVINKGYVYILLLIDCYKTSFHRANEEKRSN